jgi:hypothetical protein
MTHPRKLGAIRTARSFVAQRSNDVQTGWFLPQCGQIVVNIVAAVAAVVNAGQTGFPGLSVLTGSPPAPILRP